MKLALNTESATALREFAEAMPLAIDNIAESTEKVVQVYQSVAEDVGPHNQDFYNMLMLIKSAQETAAEAVQALPPMLNATADKIDAYVDWSDKYDDVRERLLTNGHGGTKFPISRIKSTLDVRSRDLVTVLITDGDLGNINESVSYFRDYLNDDNKLYIFLLGGSKSLHSYEPLKNIGAKIYNANNANEFCDMVLTDME